MVRERKKEEILGSKVRSGFFLEKNTDEDEKGENDQEMEVKVAKNFILFLFQHLSGKTKLLFFSTLYVKKLLRKLLSTTDEISTWLCCGLYRVCVTG